MARFACERSRHHEGKIYRFERGNTNTWSRTNWTEWCNGAMVGACSSRDVGVLRNAAPEGVHCQRVTPSHRRWRLRRRSLRVLRFAVRVTREFAVRWRMRRCVCGSRELWRLRRLLQRWLAMRERRMRHGVRGRGAHTVRPRVRELANQPTTLRSMRR